MAITYPPEIEVVPTKTQSKRQTGKGLPRPRPRIALDLGSDDELLLLENKTALAWMVYHNFHQLGIIDVGEMLAFHIRKHGKLSARPCATQDVVEYLVLPLRYSINVVCISKRIMGKNLQIYDLQVL